MSGCHHHAPNPENECRCSFSGFCPISASHHLPILKKTSLRTRFQSFGCHLATTTMPPTLQTSTDARFQGSALSLVPTTSQFPKNEPLCSFSEFWLSSGHHCHAPDPENERKCSFWGFRPFSNSNEPIGNNTGNPWVFFPVPVPVWFQVRCLLRVPTGFEAKPEMCPVRSNIT